MFRWTRPCSGFRPGSADFEFDNELVGAIAIVGTTKYVHEPVDPEQLKLLSACTKAISLRLNSTAYEGLGIPKLREFIFD